MTVTQEMTSVIFQKPTIESVKEQFNSKRQKFPIDTNSMNFRLFRTKSATINLELLCRDDMGYYFKPIGFYEQKNGFLGGLNKKIEITLLNEFYNDYEYLLKNHEITLHPTNVKKLDIIFDFLIGAFSRESYSLALQMFNFNITYKAIYSNGFKYNLVLIADKEHIVVTKGDVTCPPIVTCGFYKKETKGIVIYSNGFDGEFEKLALAGLISAFQND